MHACTVLNKIDVNCVHVWEEQTVISISKLLKSIFIAKQARVRANNSGVRTVIIWSVT